MDAPQDDLSDAVKNAPILDRRTALKGVGLLAATTVPVSSFAFAEAPTRGASLQSPVTAPTGPTLTATLADYAAKTSFDKLPPAVRERAKKVICDEIACAYFGRRSDGGHLAAQYAIEFGGAPEVAIYGTDRRVSVAYAALANGTAGHGEEVDGTHVVGGHPGASIVHAAVAVAQKTNASGAELINAVVLGYDVGIRLVEACGGMFRVRDKYHLKSDLLYALGAAAAACRLLDLDADRFRHAFALATFQANGLEALFAERRHISKSFCNGQWAFAGISSAYMARIGLEGNDDIIGTDAGVLAAWGDPQQRLATTRALGTEFKIMGGNFKFYNAGQPIHTAIEAAMTLVEQHRIAPSAIEAITVGLPANALKTVNDRDMHNISVQDMVSANLALGGFGIGEQPFPAVLDNPDYKRIRAMIVAQVDPDLQREFPNGRGARVTITAKTKRYSMRVDNPKGHSLRGEPSWADLSGKWVGSLPGCDARKALSLAQKLETLPSAGALFDAYAGINPQRVVHS